MSYSTRDHDFRDKDAGYSGLMSELTGLIGSERDAIANAANSAALLFDALPDVNWVGYYFLREGELVVGPFQGRPACVRIAMGAGVCGTAAQRRETLIVKDVHTFPGHIVCDPVSRSEIVVPLVAGTRLLGVLDLDSPSPGRFDAADARGLERLVKRLVPAIAAAAGSDAAE